MKYLLSFIGLILGTLPFLSQTTTDRADQLIQYFQNQQYAQAAQYLQTVLRSDTTNQHVLSLLGYAYYMSNQLPQAGQVYGRLLALDSTNLRARYYLGKINVTKGNLPLARTYYCQLVQRKKGVARYYKELAAVFSRLNNPNAAGWYNQLAYHANPNDPEVTVRLADYWLEQTRYREADSIIFRALQQDSLQAGLLITGIRSAYLQEKYDQIFPLTQRLESMHYISLKPFLQAAIARFNLEQYDSCIATCRLLTANKLANETIYYLEALAYKALKQYEPALAYLDTCIHMAMDPKADDYFTAKGAVLEQMHQPSNALKVYDTAYYLFHAPLQLYNKARIYDSQFENYRVALRYYRDFMQKSTDSTGPKAATVRAYVRKRSDQLEKWQKAIQDRKRSTKGG